MLRFICALILLLVLATPSWAQQSLVGTYKLVSLQRELDGKATPLPGNPPRGYLIITPKAYVLLQTEGTRKYGPSTADKAALWESMIAMGGTYRVEGKKMVMNPDVHSNESMVGAETIRYWEIKGNRLVISSDPRPWARDPSKKIVSRQEFEKID
jgi:hypothetical protein